MMSVVCLENGEYIQYTKGAPDEVLKVCTHALIDGEKVRLNDKVKEKILTENKKMADKALRVLCAATKEYGKNPPKSYDAGYLEKGLCYVGPVSYTHLDVYKRQERNNQQPL